MRKILMVLGWVAASLTGRAQAKEKNLSDSADRRILQEVVVRAYEQNRRLSEVPAAVGLITSSQLNRYNTVSLVPAVNTVPGVHMEERSPGSYRLSFRGSTLRSPFGVRNVKIYLDGIPFTDPGGNTYLNQLSFYNVQSMEILKGPAGSLYGAGTGGAILIKTQPDNWQPGVSVNYTIGSFNTNSINAQVRLGQPSGENIFTYTHQTSDGYRAQTSLRRDIGTWQATLKSNEKQTLTSFLSYGDLYYQTPGGLTLIQYNADPRQARPKTAATPSAQEAQAAIFQKTFLAGITNTYHFNEHWENTTSSYGAYTQLKNPTFLNYEIRNEPHFGGRTVFSYQQMSGATSLRFNAGAEAQKGFFKTEDFGNTSGSPDTVQTNDNIDTWTYSLFAQADLQLPRGWGLTAGASYNKSFTGIQRLSIPGFVPRNKTFSNQVAPRLALSKKITSDLFAYLSVSKGFSPPTVAEILPSGQSINTDLQPEHGISYEAGIKSSWLRKRLYLEITGFYFRLQNAIVVRQDSTGASYYINAGATRQRGLESQISYQLLPAPTNAVNGVKLWLSYTLDDFTYQDFTKNTISYSGKKLPGIANNTVAAGADIFLSCGLYTDITYYYSDKLPLDDANTAFAGSYTLMGARLGYKSYRQKKINWNVFAGVDNIFNVRYSLGDDVNAAGGRYYNAAPGINYYAGISLRLGRD
jgi:iron complex outermembrane recepter protein